MVFDPRSRYAAQSAVAATAADGTPITLSAPRVAPAADVSPGGYDVQAADRLDTLGHSATGDSTLWWRLADANPWPDATRLERPGQRIDLPGA